MLKKIIIICLIFSFLFIGGFGLMPAESSNSAGPHSGHVDENGEWIPGPAPNSGDGIPDGSGWFIDPDSSIIIAQYGQNGNEHSYDQEDGPIRDRDCQD
jgi:hypothetical protein